MNIYEWREGMRNKPECSPEEAFNELERIRKSNGGEISAPVVVKAAKKKAHKFHGFFEWRDQIAGKKWREQQARTLIGGIKVRVEESEPVRAYQHVSIKSQPTETEEKPEPVSYYTSTEQALADPQMRAYILSRALSEAESWRKKYQDLEELSDVFSALDQVAA